MNNSLRTVLICITFYFLCACKTGETSSKYLKVSENQRFLQYGSGDPFFWLGDTGWLLFKKLNREEAEKYLSNRSEKGYNVIQVMVIHDIMNTSNAYGDSALINNNLARPLTTEGNLFDDSLQYDYWDHVDFIIDKAAEKGLYMALVPIWGSNVRAGHVTMEEAKTFASFLAERYKERPNIIWLTGGDVLGSDSLNIWMEMGKTIDQVDTLHLISFHPYGRTQSSTWFHEQEWLDFNMFQSGHRRYDQDDTELCYGEDNWRYVVADYKKIPKKPTIDGEPSYEGIPQGLHDTLQPYWTDNDVRRYAYWSVFAGGFGFTYGNNAVMQFHKPEDTIVSYGSRKYWTEAINDPGAPQMIHLKRLMLSKPYLERIPDQSLIADEQGEKYNYLIATRGKDYAFIYTYTGRTMKINMGKISGEKVKASWFDPRTGGYQEIGIFENKGILELDPPGVTMDGNDWVLVLEGNE